MILKTSTTKKIGNLKQCWISYIRCKMYVQSSGHFEYSLHRTKRLHYSEVDSRVTTGFLQNQKRPYCRYTMSCFSNAENTFNFQYDASNYGVGAAFLRKKNNLEN